MNDLLDSGGGRKYLNRDERAAFLRAARRFPREVRAFCEVLNATGCRISEALALTRGRVDFDDGALIFKSLKKRRKAVYRAVPVSPALLDILEFVFDLRGTQKDVPGLRLWHWSRPTAWRRVKAVMEKAEIAGPQASPKGLRHGFGVAAVAEHIPPNLIQRWMGHAQLETTAIYLNAVGDEERALAARLWSD